MVTYPVKSRLNFLDKFEKINSKNNLENEFRNNLENLPPVTESHVNLLLIDKTVSKYQLFVDSSNESTYPLVYSPRYDSKLLLDHIIKSFKHIERIAVVCHGQENITKFLNNEPFDSDSNIHFMKEIVNGFNVKTIDFLACDTLKYAQWINYFKQLNQMGLIVGASDDRTGNIKYGGDWLLESTGNDIKPVYWTNLIDNYSELLEEVEYNDDTIRYKYNTTTKKASVVGVVDKETLVNANIQSTIKLDLDAYTVTTIETYAFASCTSLTSIVIPDSVTDVKEGAFANCTALTRVTIGSGVEIIEQYAFYYCTSLTSIVIPNSVTAIKDSAFAICTALTSVTIRSGVTIIEQYAFYYCTALTSVTIGSGVTIIEQYAFYDCTALESIYFKTDEFKSDVANDVSFFGIPTTTIFYLANTQANVTFITNESGEYLGYELKIGSPPDEIDPDYIQSIIQMLNKITDDQLSNLFIKINKDKDNLSIFLKAINN
jgi:hypothetical protein